jgi:hypothetical protein
VSNSSEQRSATDGSNVDVPAKKRERIVGCEGARHCRATDGYCIRWLDDGPLVKAGPCIGDAQTDVNKECFESYNSFVRHIAKEAGHERMHEPSPPHA